MREEMLFAPGAGLLAMVIANPVQLLWDFITIYLRYFKIDMDNPKSACLLLSYQILVTFIFLLILFWSMHLAI